MAESNEARCGACGRDCAFCVSERAKVGLPPHRCKARAIDGTVCRLFAGHDGAHGDGEGTVWRNACATCGGPTRIANDGIVVCVSGSLMPHPVAAASDRGADHG